MIASSQRRVLLVTGAGASEGAVTPVLAALEATDLSVRAIDIGRAGRNDGVLDWVMRPFSSDFAERRLQRELDDRPPDVTITFDPASTSAMSTARDRSSNPAPVIAVVNDLEPLAEWGATDADRYLAVDDHAAVALADLGIAGERVLTIGPICEYGYALAGAAARADLRTRYKLGDRPIALLHIEGFGYELTSQIALQLSLMDTRALFLFDAGADADAATALRRQVPTLGLDAKLFGQTEDAPRFWRMANAIVARANEVAVARTLVVGAMMVCFEPEGDDARRARAIEDRRRGVSAGNALLLSSALGTALGKLRKDDALTGADGAATVADIAQIVAHERREVIDERLSAERASTRARVDAAVNAAEAAARTTSAAGGLEDLSGGGGAWEDLGAAAASPDADELDRLKSELSVRLSQMSNTVSESHRAAEQWDERAASARKKGDDDLARKAERAAEGERARMHAALAEMAEMQAEAARLDKAASQAPPRREGPRPGATAGAPHTAQGSYRSPPSAGARYSSIDDELRNMKRSQGRAMEEELRDMKHAHKKRQGSLDDELAALKRKMRNKKKR